MLQKHYSFALFFFCLVGFSQNNFTLKIELTDLRNENIKEGIVYLLDAETNQIIKTISIANEQLFFTSLKEGNYNIQIYSEEYENLDQKFSLNKNLNLKLILSKIGFTKLNEIVLKSKNKTFSYLKGNVKVDIANSIFKAIPNTVELLSKLPGVQISGDKEGMSIIGKGNPLIYIDNQKVGMNDLNALSVEDIKSIEIIKNPSSKYEAEGRAVVLILRKLSKNEGFETKISEVISLKKRFNNYWGINSSFKKNNTEIKANFGINQLNPWESIGNDFEILNNTINSNFIAESYTKRRQIIFGNGIFYQINEDDYLSFNLSGKIQKDYDRNTTNSFISQNNLSNFIETLNNNDENRNFINSFINYNKKIKSLDAALFTGFQFSNFYQNSKSVILNNYDDTQFDLTQNRNQKFNVNVLSGRADLEKLIKNEVKWEFGALYLAAHANTNFEVLDFISNNNEDSNYRLKEQNIAGYTQLSGKNKKIEYLFGIRAENTEIKGKYAVDNFLLIDRNYTNFFPKIQLDFTVDSTKTISFNYAKSISRPNYSATSQISIYTNPFLIFSRNINLNPTITDEISGTFQFKNKSVKLNFSRSKNPVYFAFEYDKVIKLISFNSINYAKESGVNLEFSLPFKHHFWSSSNSFNFVLNKVEDNAAVVNGSKPYLYYYSNHIFELSKQLDFSVTGWGFTEREEGVFKRNSLFIMDLALSKTLFKNFDCTLRLNDIFRNMNFNENFIINEIASKGIYYTDTREIALSIRYKFGKIKDSTYKERNIDENSNRIR
ncbi:outer membrane beta-barrel family protein [Flavobacterium algicola]|uniref:outer membrane beta-barrel family protein n=1 Tax=Flavobacterium algicola TaxID=556529 RepID=UPI001EFCF9AC|nr:outer membrane beta-barrel family protein [Flavobacterium algicola]MCG9792322.1 TonB-dependent receptor [Flavobacterium algicola]